MNPLAYLRTLSLTGWLIVLAVAAALVVGAFAYLNHGARVAAENKVGAAMGQARGQATSDAGRIIDNAHDAANASEDLTRKNADAIDHAPGADQRLDPGFSDAVRRSVCQRPSYRRTAECVQLLGPEKPPR